MGVSEAVPLHCAPQAFIIIKVNMKKQATAQGMLL